MKANIAYFLPKLFKNVPIWTILLLLASCNAVESNLLKFHDKITLETPNGDKVSTYVAMSERLKTQGLSGVKSNEFTDSQAMIFYYKEDGPRNFWMPDTYFNLEIFYLDKNLKVLSVERNVPHHPGRVEPPKIPRVKSHFSRYVLEMKSSSSLAKKLRPGQTLKVTKGSFP
jgi:uncharacterized membrane protein (UPF0127 family)